MSFDIWQPDVGKAPSYFEVIQWWFSILPQLERCDDLLAIRNLVEDLSCTHQVFPYKLHSSLNWSTKHLPCTLVFCSFVQRLHWSEGSKKEWDSGLSLVITIGVEHVRHVFTIFVWSQLLDPSTKLVLHPHNSAITHSSPTSLSSYNAQDRFRDRASINQSVSY